MDLSMKNFKLTKLAILAVLGTISAQSIAGGLVLPDNNLRSDLAWLSERNVIQISLSTWPLSQEEITRSLNNANITNSEQEAIIQRIKRTLTVRKTVFN